MFENIPTLHPLSVEISFTVVKTVSLGLKLTALFVVGKCFIFYSIFYESLYDILICYFN